MPALEIDGWHHRAPEHAARDAERDAALRAAGWIVLRANDHNGRDGLAEHFDRAAYVVRRLLDSEARFPASTGTPGGPRCAVCRRPMQDGRRLYCSDAHRRQAARDRAAAAGRATAEGPR